MEEKFGEICKKKNMPAQIVYLYLHERVCFKVLKIVSNLFRIFRIFGLWVLRLKIASHFPPCVLIESLKEVHEKARNLITLSNNEKEAE